MRLGRVREQIKAHNWFGVGVELMIVVVGVLIAMQVANWNEARLEHERGRTYHARIAGELALNAADLRIREAYYLQVEAHGEAALAALDQPAAQWSEETLIHFYQTSQIIIGPLARASYDEAIATGNSQHVGDAALRLKLANYYDGQRGANAYLEIQPPYRNHIRGLLPRDVQQRIWARCDDITTPDPSGAFDVRLPETCDLELTRQQIADAVASVRAAPALKHELTEYLTDLHIKLNQITGTREFAEEIMREMEAAR